MNAADATKLRVKRYVKRHPGRTCSEISQELVVPAVLVSSLLRVLRAKGELVSVGNTRGTRWHPASDE